jgi:hypothetical protein
MPFFLQIFFLLKYCYKCESVMKETVTVTGTSSHMFS